MTARITSGQSKQLKRLVEDGLDALTMSKDAAQRVIAQGGKLQERLQALVMELAAEFYILLTDEEAGVWIVEHGQKSAAEAQQIVNSFREEARRRKVADTVCLHAQILAGCQFKRDAADMGPCWEGFKYLQGWDFADPPTEHALVSWIPVPLPNSTSKTADEQSTMVQAFKTKTGLPDWYNVSFGSVNHVAGLALTHFRATGSDPFNGLVVRTDSCDADGYRLNLYWHDGQLFCDYWCLDVVRGPSLAVYAVGVVKALGR